MKIQFEREKGIGAKIHHLKNMMIHLDGRMNALDQKFSRHFLWIIGVQVTIFLAIIVTSLK